MITKHTHKYSVFTCIFAPLDHHLLSPSLLFISPSPSPSPPPFLFTTTMTDQFKGLTVKVALADGTSVIGLVTDVVNGQLSLSNGKHPFDRMVSQTSNLNI